MKLKEIPQNTVVHTPTEAEAEELLAILHENGYGWDHGGALNQKLNWEPYNNTTCYKLYVDDMSVTYDCMDWFQRYNEIILTLAEFKELYCEEDKPQPKFKVGDKVKVVDCQKGLDLMAACIGEVTTISDVVEEDGYYNIAADKGTFSWREDWLEPYTEPETKPTEVMEENKEINKELNLCELLKGHEGETFYSPIFGERKFVGIEGEMDNYPISFGEAEFYDFGIDGCWSDGGQPILFPSRELYEKYPLDAYSAWKEWQEGQKKYRMFVSYLVDDNEGFDSKDTMMFFRTSDERDKALDEIKAIIEKYSKQ